MRVVNKINWKHFEDIEDKAKYDYLEEIGQDVIDKVRQRVPVQTGNLLNHTYFTADDGHLVFHSDTPYAEAVDARVHFMEEVEFADWEGMLAEKVRRDTE